MSRLKIFLVLFILSLSKKFLVRADNGFLSVLKPTSDHNGLIFELVIDISSEIQNSAYGDTSNGMYRLKTIPFSKDGERYIFIELKTTYVDRIREDPQNVPSSIILSASGRIILPKNYKPTINLNIYKTISNFLLFDYPTFERIKNEGSSFYTVNMPTIYGHCDIESLWHQTDEASYSVEQFFDPTACSNYSDMSFSDIGTMSSNYNLKINNNRKYNFAMVKDALVMKSLKTSQQIFWKPIHGKSLTHELKTTYNFILIEETALSFEDTDFDFSNDQSLELLTSDGKQFCNELSFQSLKLMENFNSNTLIKAVKKELGHIVDIWKRHPINSKAFKEPLPWEIVKTTRLLELLEFEHIVRLWTSLKDATTEEGLSKLDAFYNLIPLSGSEGSVLFMKKLIFDGSISQKLTDRMMAKLAGSIKNPTLTVLAALKELTAQSNSSSAVLAYTGAVGMAYKKNPSVEVAKFLKEVEEEMFSVLLDSSTSYEQQRLYIQALGNLESVSLTDSRIVKFLSENSDEIYLYCIMALEKSTENPFEIMVGILSEKHRSSELKATALGIALINVPSPKDFEILARMMDGQANNELYNVFEATVRALVKDNVLPESAILWLRQRVPLKRSTAFVYHSSKDFPMAFSVRGKLFFNDTTMALEHIYVSIYQNYHGKNVKMYTVFIRLIEADKISRLGSYGDAIWILMATLGKLKYELTVSRGSRVIMSAVDGCNFKPLLNHLHEIFEDLTQLPFKSNMGDVFQHLNLNYFFPTDAGKYAHLYYSVPWMVAAKLNFHKVDEKSIENMHPMKIAVSLNFTAQSVTGMDIYQPKLGALQGTRESTSIQLTQQIALKFYKGKSRRDLNFDLELTDDLTPLFGIQFKKFASVNLNKIGDSENDEDIFANEISVQNSDKYRGHLSLWDTDIGVKLHSEIKTYEAPVGNMEFPTSISEISRTKPFSEFFKNNEDFLVSLLSYINWNFLAYSAYTYNFKAVVEPSERFPIKKYSLKGNPFNGVFLELKDKEDRVKVTYKVSLPRYKGSHGPGVSILRMIPGKDSSMWCFSKLKDERQESIYHISYGVGQEEIQDCIEDQFQIVLGTKSEFSNEQIQNHNQKGSTYIDCMYQSSYLRNWNPTNNYKCAEAATSLRYMTIKVNYKNAPKGFFKHLNQFWIWFMRTNNGRLKENFPNVEGSGDITIKAKFPMQSHSVNVDVFLPDEKYSFTFPSDILHPNNIAFKDFSHLREYFKPPPHCIIVASDTQRRSHDHYLPTFTDSWTEVAKIYELSIFVKKILDDKLALKIEYSGEIIQAYPNTNATSGFRVTVGEDLLNELPLPSYKNKFHTVTILDTIFITSDAKTYRPTFVVGYNGRSVLIVGSNTDDSNYGECFGLQAKTY